MKITVKSAHSTRVLRIEPPGAIVYHIGLTRTTAPTSMDEVFGRSSVGVVIHETMVRVATSNGSIPVFPDAPAPPLPSERGACVG